MDNTIRNVSELQEALASLTTSSTKEPDTEISSSTENIRQDSIDLQYIHKPSSKSRLDSSQYSTNQLLYNIAGLQTGSNNKLDLLTDAVLRMHNTLQNINNEQIKQTELLATIARNTISNQVSNPVSIQQKNNNKGNGLTVQQYGFKDVDSIISELIIKLLKQVEIQIIAKGRRYRSTRVLEQNMMVNAIKVARKAEFKDSYGFKKPIKKPDNKNPMIVHLASRIGSVNDISPVLNPETLRELFEDPECSPLMSIIEDIMERLRIIRIMLPYYEADMINAISFPYFDKEGQVICDWNKIVPRHETEEEAQVMNTSIKNRERIGTMIAKGVQLRTILRAVIKDEEK